MNNLFVTICLMLPSLPFCNVETLSNDEFAQLFGFNDFVALENKSNFCTSIVLKNTKINKDCYESDNIDQIHKELIKEELSIKENLNDEELVICEQSFYQLAVDRDKNIDGLEFKDNSCSFWIIGYDRGGLEKIIIEEYEKRKN